MARLQVVAVLIAGVACCCGGGAARGATSYTITDLGPAAVPANLRMAAAHGITADGALIVGETNGATSALRYENGAASGITGMREAFAVSPNGNFIAGATTVSSTWHAVLSAGGADAADLGTLGRDNSYAYGVNDSGVVVGELRTGSSASAFVYQGGTMSVLPDFGSPGGSAAAVNNDGTIVGWSNSPSFAARHAFRYSGGSITDLGTLSGQSSSEARAISSNGLIAGRSGNRAFLYHHGQMDDLGALSLNYSDAYGVNSAGQVVGISGNPSSPVPFLFEGGAMTDLRTHFDNSDGWFAMSPRAINDAGRIVGFGALPGGSIHGFLLTPVPEPASASAAILLGAVGLRALSRRQRRSHPNG